MAQTSPLLALPGAVEAPGVDSGLPWHYGDPMGEQRATERGALLVDGSNRATLTVTGPDRLTWLHTITSQHLEQAADGTATAALVLSAQGHVEHHAEVTVLGDTVYLQTEADRAGALSDYLTAMVFWSKVEIGRAELGRLELSGAAAADLLTAVDAAPAAGAALPWEDGFVRQDAGRFTVVLPRERLLPTALRLREAGARLGGSWAAQALRIADRRPRIGLDTDERTIPNELPWLADAVHLAKGCYRGQETVARVHNLGRPPRRLVLLHLDGSVDRLPEVGDELLTDAGRVVGRVGSSAQHYELGPIALALVKSAVPVDAALLAGGVDARIDPDDAPAPNGPPRSAVDRHAFTDLRRR